MIKLAFCTLVFCLTNGISMLYSQDQQILWYDAYPAEGAENAQSVEIDSEGNIVMVGSFTSETIIFGDYSLQNNGGADLFIVKYNPESEVLWAMSAGNAGDDYANSVSIDASDNIYITGSFNSGTLNFGDQTLNNVANPYNDIFLVKLNSEGISQWAVSAGGAGDDVALAVATAPSGEVVITGHFSSDEINFQNINIENTFTGKDAFVARYNTNGIIQWVDGIGGFADDIATSVAIAPNGIISVGGHYYSTALTIDSYLLSNPNPGWSSDAFVISYNADSSVNWAKGFGSTGSEITSDIALNTNGDVILTGGFESLFLAFDNEIVANTAEPSRDIFIVLMNSSGEVQWAKSHGSINSDMATSIATTNNGDILFTGYFMEPEITIGNQTITSLGDGDMLMVQYDLTGTVQWTQHFGGSAFDVLYAIDCDNNGNIALCGSFQSDEIFVDEESLLNGGSEDFIIIKMHYNSSGISSLALSNSAKIYPNPSSGIVHFESENIREIKIYSALGQQVLQANYTISQNSEILDLSSLTKGCYFLLWNENGIWRREVFLLQ